MFSVHKVVFSRAVHLHQDIIMILMSLDLINYVVLCVCMMGGGGGITCPTYAKIGVRNL